RRYTDGANKDRKGAVVKQWVCQYAEWLILTGYLLVIALYVLFDKRLLP
ncbi:unnamed protein product, partial [marine sediment metagenome]